MITGVHAIVYSKDAERVREFFRDVLGFPSVDAGEGWLIFGLPPAELAAHPTESADHHELRALAREPVPIRRAGNLCWSPTSDSRQITARAIVDSSVDDHAQPYTPTTAAVSNPKTPPAIRNH